MYSNTLSPQLPLVAITPIIIWLVSVADITRPGSYWRIVEHYSPVMPTGRLRARKTKAKRHVIKKLINVERSVFAGNSKI